MGKFIEFKQASRKIEFAHFYKRSVEIVESYKPASLMIAKIFDKAYESLALAQDMAISNRKYPLTAEQKEAMKRMDRSVSVLKRFVGIRLKQLEMEVDCGAGDDNTDTEAFYSFIDSYLDGYSTKNTYQKTSSLEKMLAVYEADAGMKLVVEKELIREFMAKVSADFEALNAVYKSRRKSIANFEKLRTAEVKRTLYFRLRELFAFIEMAELVHTELDYSGMIDELNEEIKTFNRATKPLKMPTNLLKGELEQELEAETTPESKLLLANTEVEGTYDSNMPPSALKGELEQALVAETFSEPDELLVNAEQVSRLLEVKRERLLDLPSLRDRWLTKKRIR